MQLAFAVIPLIHFVSDKAKMGVFTIKPIVQIISWLVAGIILTLNIKLFLESVISWLGSTQSLWLKALIIVAVAIIFFVLLVTIFYPFILKRKIQARGIHPQIPADLLDAIDTTHFARVALALDFSSKDKTVIQYALRLAKENTSFILIHVVESASALVMGHEAQDFETQNDQADMDEYVALFKQKGLQVTGVLGFKDRVDEIARIIKDNQCDLLVIGSHGHKTAKDWLFGETINSVRHKIDIPVFIAR